MEATPAGQIRFGECVIDPLTRTIVRRGQPQAFEPKVFNVLVYLILHRDRVVSKRELLDNVWGPRVVVTDSAVSRMVMKGRRLIGDDTDETAVIKTVNRVGYRFTAAVVDGGKSGEVAAQARTGNIAVLPFLNKTGRVEYSWADLGLMWVTIDALRGRAPLGVVPAGDVLALVGGNNALALHDAADKLQRAFNATEVVQAELVLDEKHALRLRYGGAGPRLGSLRGELAGADALELGRQLARLVARATAGTEVAPSGDIESEDPFVRSVRLRVRQALEEERWDTARKLLRVMLDFHPEDVQLQLQYGRCLAWLCDPEALPLLQGLLERASVNGERRLQADALHGLAILRHASGLGREAEDLLSQALKIAEHEEDREHELLLLISLGMILADAGNTSVALWILDRAGLLAQVLKNQAVFARVLDLRGQVALLREDLTGAQGDFEKAGALCEAFGLQSSAAFSLKHLGWLHADQGRMREAAACLDKAWVCALQSGHPVAIGTTAAARTLAGSLWTGHLQPAQEMVHAMRATRSRPSAVIEAYADLLQAALAARAGDPTQCIELLERAEAAYTKPSFASQVASLRIRVLISLGLLGEAADLCEELQGFAVGRWRAHLGSAVMHCRALIARADGVDAAALQLMRSGIEGCPPTTQRADMHFDAAWICLDTGDLAQANRWLLALGGFMANALASAYGPALLAQARLMHLQGSSAEAAALQRRYCEMMSCPPQSAAARCLAVYESGDTASIQFPRLRPLPSLFDIVPHLGPSA